MPDTSRPEKSRPEKSGPRVVDTVLRNLLAYGLIVAALLTMAGGDPHTYDAAPAVYDAKNAEIVGTWRCVDGTEVVFHSDGTAAVTLLDGQELDYDHGWRLTGPGTWELVSRRPAGWNYGQHVLLHLPARTAAAARGDVPPRRSAPERYLWTFELRRDARQALELYFFFGDPSARSAYVLEKDA
ncbi:MULTISPECIES: hypothetical protein [unclassified Streptomyces]|uniref:hypothetical protein n=1 Tax=unclassified Streptomyces TaxID=2593676 RepID=UPI0020352927|nr:MULTISPECIES: hypothetical protein [unclassified Streptomyces]